MKILMVNKFLYPRGGAETYMFKIGGWLTAQGHQVEYFGMYDPRNTVGNRAGQYTAAMDFRGHSPARLLYPLHILYSFETRRKIGRVLDDFAPDIVHLNNINFQLTPSILDAVAARGIPMIQTVHDYQMICPNHLLYNLREARVCERCVHGSVWNCTRYGCIHGSRLKSLFGSLEALLYRRRGSYRLVDCYLCPSRFLEAKLLDAAPFYRGRTRMLRNFIELPEPVTGTGPRDSIVFAGRLDREKGIGLLAEAARALPDVRFWVAGTGACAETLGGIPNLTLTGFLSGAPLRALVAGAAAVVVPSLWYENCPLSILEAQSLGTPVITVNAGGMAELVEDGVTGLLMPRADLPSLITAIRRALADPGALAAMSARCLEQRDRMLTLEGYGRRLLEIYADCRTARASAGKEPVCSPK